MKHFRILLICTFFFSSCSTNGVETPYFEVYKIHFEIMIPPFFTGDMNIKGDKSFIITYVSPGDTVDKIRAINDTVVGKISDLEMLKLVELCKLADVYKINFTDRSGVPTISNINDFPFEIEISNIYGRTNKLSFSSGIIPKESNDLQTYSLTLMDTYYKWR